MRQILQISFSHQSQTRLPHIILCVTAVEPLFSVSIYQMQAANSDEGVRQLLDSPEFEFRFDSGICQPSQSLALSDRDAIVSSITMHHTIYSCRSELDEFTEGLSVLNFLDLMKQYEGLRSLFEHSQSSLTADFLQDLWQLSLGLVCRKHICRISSSW